MNLGEDLIQSLKEIRFGNIHISDEDHLEDILFSYLKSFSRENKLRLSRQEKNFKDRMLKPDIIIGENKYLIELKFLRKNAINDIYRMYYQAVKYSKIAREKLIFFIYDPEFKLKRDERIDLQTLAKNIEVVVKN